MRPLFFALLILFSFSSCEKVIETVLKEKDAPVNAGGYSDYLIPKGSHSAKGNNIKRVNKSEMRFLALFDSSCIYTTVKPANAKDINKLYGFSDGGSAHHINSARFGWLWNGRAIEIYAYCYADTVRNSRLLGTVNIGESAEMSLRVEPGKYQFYFKGTATTLTRSSAIQTSVIDGYQLYPYFGGDETAPHDVHVFIKEINI